MIEIGAKCKIELDEREYKIIDFREKKIVLKKPNDDTTYFTSETFVDLEDIEDPKRTLKNISIIKINLIKE